MALPVSHAGAALGPAGMLLPADVNATRGETGVRGSINIRTSELVNWDSTAFNVSFLQP